MSSYRFEPRGGRKGDQNVRYISILLCFFLYTSLHLAIAVESAVAGEEADKVIVTATRIETPVDEVGSDVTIISGKEIEKSQKKTVAEILRGVGSLDVVRTGGPGSTTSVFIRGAKAEHTLVMIDGVEMNDPISAGRTFNFADLTVDNIERIEIIKGPQSTLYGSDAMGGVINIITKKGSGRPRAFISGEAGSFSTYRESAGLSGGTSLVNYSLSLSREDTDGISSAAAKDGNTEADAYENTTVAGRFGLTPTEYLSLDLTARYTDARHDIDNGGGRGMDDPNNTMESKRLSFRTSASLFLLDGILENTVGFSLTDQESENNNGTDPLHPASLTLSSFDSQSRKTDLQSTLRMGRAGTLTAGIEYEEEEGESKFHSESAWGPFTSNFSNQKARNTGYYAEESIGFFERLFLTVGVRSDNHNRFGSETTYRATGAYKIKETGTTLKATFGTGFKAPTLFQLFSQYGDVHLLPETSTGWDAGIEQTLASGRVSLGVTYFANNFDDLIDFDSATWKYRNISGAETSGVEISAMVRPLDDLSIRARYTYTDTLDRSTRMQLLRRAPNSLSLKMVYDFSDKGNVNMDINYVGTRDDKDFSTFPATRVTLGPYTLVDLAASYALTKNVTITGRIENLLDQDYEEVAGFGTPGIGAYGGVRVTF